MDCISEDQFAGSTDSQFMYGDSLLICPITEPMYYETGNPFEFHVYEGKDGFFQLYEDSGDGYDYEKGMYNLISVSWNDTEKELCIGESKFVFPQSICGRSCVLYTSSGGKKAFTYNGEKIKIKIDGK